MSDKKWEASIFRGLFYAFMSGVFASLASVIVKQMKNVHPGQLALYRFIGTFVMSMPETVKTGQNPFGPPEKRIFIATRGIFGGVAYFFIYLAYRYLSLGEASVIIFSSPVFVTIFARLVFKEPCNVFQSVSVMLTVIGIIFTTNLPSHLHEGTVSYSSEKIYGLVAAVLALLCMTTGHLVIRKMQSVPQSIVTFNFSWLGILEIAFMTAMLGNFKWHYCGSQRLYILLLALFSYGNVSLTVKALQCEHAGPVSTVRAASDIGLAFLWQIIIFHDVPDSYGIIGAVLVFVSIVLASLGKWLSSSNVNLFSCKMFKNS